MKLEKLEGRPLNDAEILFRKSYIKEKGALWEKPMSFATYERLSEEGRIAETGASRYYRERSKEGSFNITAGSVGNSENIDIITHLRYSYPVLHNHDYVEIIYVAVGECLHFLEDSSFGMHAGDVCVLAPNAFHALSCTNDESCIVNIMMNRKYFDRHFLGILRGGKLLSGYLESILYNQSANPYILFPTGADSWLRTLAQRLISEKSGEPHAYEYSIKLLSNSFLLHLVREYEMMAIVPSRKSGTQNDLIVAVLGYLSIHYSNTSLSDCAAFFGYSPSYLSRMIHENTGKTFNSIILEQQMERAADLLCNTQMSMTEIAQEVGCFDSSHFGKKFRSFFGCSPKQYAEKYGSGREIAGEMG